MILFKEYLPFQYVMRLCGIRRGDIVVMMISTIAVVVITIIIGAEIIYLRFHGSIIFRLILIPTSH